MKTVTIITEQMTDRALSTAIPATGVVSVNIRRDGSGLSPDASDAHYRAFRSPRFTPACRIDLVVADDAVDTVIDCVSFAHGAGFFRDAEVWVNAPALAA